jgi:hypothetical protein
MGVLMGVLPTFHNLHKWRLTDLAACRLCHAADDTQGHAINECPEHTGQRMERHHRACRAIVKAIAAAHWGGCILSADVGSLESCQSDGIPHYSALTAALPSLMSEQERRPLPRRSVPDILMRITDAKTGREAIHLVELKYCRDNAPEDAAQAAENQHAALMQAILTSTTAPPGRSVVLHKFIRGGGLRVSRCGKRAAHARCGKGGGGRPPAHPERPCCAESEGDLDNAPAHPKNQRITANAPAGGGLMSHLHHPVGAWPRLHSPPPFFW